MQQAEWWCLLLTRGLVYLREWSVGSWFHHVRLLTCKRVLGTGYTAIVETVLPLAVTTRANVQTPHTFMHVKNAMDVASWLPW